MRHEMRAVLIFRGTTARMRPIQNPMQREKRRRRATMQVGHIIKAAVKSRTGPSFVVHRFVVYILLGTARVRRFPLPEIVLWTTASQHPSESQTSECSDLLSRSRATFLIAAQRQPGKLNVIDDQNFDASVSKLRPASN